VCPLFTLIPVNFDLFAFLLQSQNVNLPKLLDQLKNSHRLDFVLEFWHLGKEKAQLVGNINNVWPTIWQEISQTENIQEEDWRVNSKSDRNYKVRDLLNSTVTDNPAYHVSACC